MAENTIPKGFKKTEIGTISEEWEVVSIKDIGDISTSSVDKKSNQDEKEINLVNYMDVYNNLHREITSSIKFMVVTAKDAQIKSSNLKKGDILFTPTSETPDDIGISAVVTEDLQNTLFSYHLLRLRLHREIDLKFKRYMFNTPIVLRQFSKIAQGATRFVLTRDNFLKIKLPLPPLPEQQKIAEILTTVDCAIEETDNIIKKCETIKKGMMQVLLTKGIPGRHRKFKETELGEIPEEWTLKKLAEISTKIGDGLHSTPKYVDSSTYYFINGNNLFEGSIIITDSTKCVNEEEFKKYHISLSDRTILMSINGTIGNLANFNNEKIILGKSAAYINVAPAVDKRFIYYLLQMPIIRKYYQDELTGTTIRNLSLKSIRNTPIPLPSIKEQQEISEIMIKIDERIIIEKKKKNVLQTNKQALMQKLLTGQIRVMVN